MFLLYVSTMLLRKVTFFYTHDWKSIKGGSEFNLEDYIVYSCQDKTKSPKIFVKIGQSTLKPRVHIWSKNLIFKIVNLLSQLFRLILISLNPNLAMNTNEFDGLIGDGPFFPHCWGWIWDILIYPDRNIPYNFQR